MEFCDSSDIKKSGKGIHSLRLMVAVLDTAGTIFGAYLISEFFKINFSFILVLAFIVSVVSQQMFCAQ
jgi:hypothetical protein